MLSSSALRRTWQNVQLVRMTIKANMTNVIYLPGLRVVGVDSRIFENLL